MARLLPAIGLFVLFLCYQQTAVQCTGVANNAGLLVRAAQQLERVAGLRLAAHMPGERAAVAAHGNL